MLLIDTNTLYYAFGLSTHSSVTPEKIIKAMSISDSVMLSSVSLGEFVVKYRKHARIIRKVCSFMHQHQISLHLNQQVPFKYDILKNLCNIRQPELNKLTEELVNIKTNVESSYATAVFFCVFVSDTIFECNLDPYNVPDFIFDFLSIVFKQTLRPIISDLFKISYQKAYKTSDVENVIRYDFYNYLCVFVSLVMPLCNHVMKRYHEAKVGDTLDVLQIISEFSDEDWSAKMESYKNKIISKGTPAAFVKTKGLQYGKSINDKHLEQLLIGLKNSFDKTIDKTSISEYIFDIVSNTITNGGAFRKNDIIDAQVLSCLQQTDTILSFDRGMIKHLEKYADTRIEYQNSIRLIKSILEVH